MNNCPVGNRRLNSANCITLAEGLDVTFHDFRGIFITLGYRAGASIKEAAEALGLDEKECERIIRQHDLATGAEAAIRRPKSDPKKNTN